ncbi:MAG: hypothetical protein DRN96_09405 [Thermoproteota archaeon]|nr:MAG: hypothetical protein DRN96_09405 [Candidatus Korarchaeota archaeon]
MDVPEWVKSYITELYLQGEPTSEIARRLGIGEDVVEEILESVRRSLPGGLSEMKRLADAIREAEVSLDDAISGAMIARRLRELGIPASSLISLLDELSRVLVSGMSAEELLRTAAKVYRISYESGIDVSEVGRVFERKAKEVAELERKAKKLREEVLELSSRFSRLTGKLLAYGVSIECLEKLVQLLDKVKELGYAPHKVVKLLLEARA